jgi:hypothetical protein
VLGKGFSGGTLLSLMRINGPLRRFGENQCFRLLSIHEQAINAAPW